MLNRLTASIFSLAQCPHCHGHYAICPNPAKYRHILLFSARALMWPPLAAVDGGLICFRCGQDLFVTQETAVLSANDKWLVLSKTASLFAEQN